MSDIDEFIDYKMKIGSWHRFFFNYQDSIEH